MNAADLKVFETVARTGGMNRAAAELHTVQSNVTTRVRLLEEELGTPLFVRRSRGVALTAAGERLLPFAIKTRQLLAEAKRAVQDDGTPSGLLTIGALETTAALRLSPILTDYIKKYPKVDLVLRTGTTNDLVADVLEHRVQGAFVSGPIDDPRLSCETFIREELAILTSPQIKDLQELTDAGSMKIVVLRTGCSLRQKLEQILAKRGVVGLRHLEFGTLESIFSCVAAGVGVTLLPKSVVGTVWQEGRVAVHDLSPAQARSDTLFVRRRDAAASTALTAFLEAARNGIKLDLDQDDIAESRRVTLDSRDALELRKNGNGRPPRYRRKR